MKRMNAQSVYHHHLRRRIHPILAHRQDRTVRGTPLVLSVLVVLLFLQQLLLRFNVYALLSLNAPAKPKLSFGTLHVQLRNRYHLYIHSPHIHNVSATTTAPTTTTAATTTKRWDRPFYEQEVRQQKQQRLLTLMSANSYSNTQSWNHIRASCSISSASDQVPFMKNDNYIEVPSHKVELYISMIVTITFIAIGLLPTIAGAAVTTTTTTEVINQSVQQLNIGNNNEAISGFIAGGVLALAKTIVKYPMDTATVRLQMINTTYTIREPKRLFDNAYVGIISPLLSNVPASAVFFAVKDTVSSVLKSYATTNFDLTTTTPVLLLLQQLCTSRTFRTCMAVGVAQIPYWIVRNPSEVIKTKEQAGTACNVNTTITSTVLDQNQTTPFHLLFTDHSTTNVTTIIQTIYDQVSFYYTGYWENIIYAYPADVLKFVTYEQLFKFFGSSETGTIQYATESAWFGAVSTGMAQYLTTPLDVVRNRIMAGPNTTADITTTLFGNGDIIAKNETTGLVDTIQQMPTTSLSPEGSSTVSFIRTYSQSIITLACTEGFDGLFAGSIPRLMKALISGAIQFVTYEETKQALILFLSNKQL